MENNEGQPTAENVCQNSAEPDIHLSKDEIITKLWNIIDDIDTYGDMAKSDDAAFRRLVEKRQKDRWKTGVTTDGFTLQIPQENDPGRAVLKFLPTLTDGTALSFLSHWSAGNFKLCRKEWPEAPEECYIGADSLIKATPKPAVLSPKNFRVDPTSLAFHSARGVMGTATDLQDDTLRRAIEAYMAALENGMMPVGSSVPHNEPKAGTAVNTIRASAIAAIEFSLSLTDGTGLNFLQFWRNGDFETCRIEWPDAPSTCFHSAWPDDNSGLHWKDASVDEDGCVSEQDSVLDAIFVKRMRRMIRGMHNGPAIKAIREELRAMDRTLGTKTSSELLTSYLLCYPTARGSMRTAQNCLIGLLHEQFHLWNTCLSVGDVPFVRNYKYDVSIVNDTLRMEAEWEEATSETAVEQPFGIGRNKGHKVVYNMRRLFAEYKEQGDAQ